MRSRLSILAALAAAALVVPLASAVSGLSGGAGAATPPYTVTTLHFQVHPAVNSLGDPSTCDIVGDLYLPRSASPRHRVPAILTTNGFGGSKADQAGLGRYFSSHGYAVLAYSGLGFGGSGCKITLDDPSTDGRAASQLISYLGGAPGIAFRDANHTQPAPVLRDVRHDAVAHNGKRYTHDPRVGMIGGSYGGEIQFAAATDDPRLDTIVPVITWNDLSYSLGPNNTDLARGVTPTNPGATKLVWGVGFSAEGVADGIEGLAGDPTRAEGCPNFATFVCPALATAGSSGYFQPSDVTALQHASVEHYLKSIKIPTLLLQGEKDTLFNLNEATTTYRSLRAQGTPVRMVWQSWGHSDLTPAPGEINLNAPNAATQYETGRVTDWFAHYLKGDSSAPVGPRFTFFRPWVHYQGNAAPAYQQSGSFPVGNRHTWYLSSTSLVTKGGAATTGTHMLTLTGGGAPTTIQKTDVIGSYFTGAYKQPTSHVPGTQATWRSGVLQHRVDVAGMPRLRLRVTAPVAAGAQSNGPGGQLVLFIRVADIGRNHHTNSIDGEVAPIRVANVNKTFTVTLPAIVHRFAKGHRIALVIEGGDANYRGGVTPQSVTIAGGPRQVFSLPVVG